MTLEAWVNPAVVSAAWRDVIYKGDDNYYLMGTTDRSGGVAAGGGTFGGGNSNAFATSVLPLNTWSFLAVTYDGATLRLYLNGGLVASQAKTGAIASSTSQLQIGGDSIYGQAFSGLIDQVRIYNGALSQAAIQTDMTAPIGTGTGGGDTVPPSAPSGLTPGAPGQNSLPLSWTASTDNVGVTGYRLYVGGTQVATTLSLNYIFGGLNCGTTYTLGVAAVDAANNVSPISTVSTGDRRLLGYDASVCTWNVDGLGGRRFGGRPVVGCRDGQRRRDGLSSRAVPGQRLHDFAQIGTASGTTYQDASLPSGTTYTYRVRAADAAGNTGRTRTR